VTLDPVGVDEPTPRTAAGTEPLLEVRDLRVTFTGVRPVAAVRGLDLAVAPAEIVGLVGESGSGKSATALALMGLLPRGRARVEGEARLRGRDLLAMPAGERRRLRGSEMAMVFQDASSSLNPVMTVGRQVAEALVVHRGVRRPVARRTAVDLLGVVGIPDPRQRLDQYPHQLSGGMRQRVMIASALACDPAILVADEPTTALDVTIQAQILDLLGRLRRELGMAVLLITHDLGVVAGLVDRIAVAYAGRIVESGPVEEVLATPGHPYTGGLLRSVPRLDREQDGLLRAIRGSPADPRADEVGCPFSPRCDFAVSECGQRPPLLPMGGGGRVAACWRVDEGLDLS
jgi:oligopeptide/dipeptide ABC transporter ATP-binding protein